jgi:hypothetical protein
VAFDADNDKHYLNHILFADHGALLDPSTADVTARCVSFLAQVGDPADAPVMARARMAAAGTGTGRIMVRPLGHQRAAVGSCRPQGGGISARDATRRWRVKLNLFSFATARQARREAGGSATDDRRPELQRIFDAVTSAARPYDIILVHLMRGYSASGFCRRSTFADCARPKWRRGPARATRSGPTGTRRSGRTGNPAGTVGRAGLDARCRSGPERAT